MDLNCSISALTVVVEVRLYLYSRNGVSGYRFNVCTVTIRYIHMLKTRAFRNALEWSNF